MLYAMPITQKLKKLIKALHQKQFRDQNALFLAEGEKICHELLKSDYYTELVVIRDSPTQDILEIVEAYADKGTPVYTAPKHQFDQISDMKTPQGILAIATAKEDEIITDEPFVALDGISDPGNVGTIIRTANWFGINQVILGKECADMYNPKAVRSTMGNIFHTRVLYKENLAEFVQENFKKYNFYGASVNTEKNLENYKPKKNFGLFFGSESNGFSEEVEKILNYQYKIEGFGKSESLNVAISVGISLYHFTKNMQK